MVANPHGTRCPTRLHTQGLDAAGATQKLPQASRWPLPTQENLYIALWQLGTMDKKTKGISFVAHIKLSNQQIPGAMLVCTINYMTCTRTSMRNLDSDK